MPEFGKPDDEGAGALDGASAPAPNGTKADGASVPDAPDVIDGDDAETEDGETEEAEDPDDDMERRHRSIGIVAIAGVATFIGAMVLINSFPNGNVLRAGSISDSASASRSTAIPPTDGMLSRLPVTDTIFTTDSIYLELNLARQNVTVHFRSGTERTFLVSSGTPALKEGMATPTGLFTIQNMQPMAISKQFHDARLHHWIGIHGGVGFHGLDGSGYYGNLGKRPSSHGCVRMSREEIAQMYKLVHPGALIMSHYGSPARVVVFCDTKDTAGAEVIDSAAVYSKTLGRDRMQALYGGRFWVDHYRPLVHLANQRVRWALEIGDTRHVPRQQVPRSSYISGYVRNAGWTTSADNAAIPTFRDGAFADFVHARDSLTKMRQREVKEEDKNIQFGE